jgi:hypothetical protein
MGSPSPALRRSPIRPFSWSTEPTGSSGTDGFRIPAGNAKPLAYSKPRDVKCSFVPKADVLVAAQKCRDVPKAYDRLTHPRQYRPLQ